MNHFFSTFRGRFVCLIILAGFFTSCASEDTESTDNTPEMMVETPVQAAPMPLLKEGKSVDWWFAFKFNAESFPGCRNDEARSCLFGKDSLPEYKYGWSQQYVFASSENPSLQYGFDCLGATESDPVGATFGQIYNGDFFYVVWNDQFYSDPEIKGCDGYCGSPWGHSKGMVAWNAAGEGFVMQVSTPSWPASGSAKHPRKTDGNTLGCIKDDDIEVSQHFFCLKLEGNDLQLVLKSLANASVATDPANLQVVNNGGPQEVQDIVKTLGVRIKGTDFTRDTLSTGVVLVSKPSKLHVPPWQMVSALHGGIPLRVASWWARPEIYSTTATTKIGCWDSSLGKPGAVQIATTGKWGSKELGLTGGLGKKYNHAKIAVSADESRPLSFFGDMNQQGTLSQTEKEECGASQNGRGGTFYALDNKALWMSIGKLISGDSAPVEK